MRKLGRITRSKSYKIHVSLCEGCDMHYTLAALWKIHIFAKKWTYLMYTYPYCLAAWRRCRGTTRPRTAGPWSMTACTRCPASCSSTPAARTSCSTTWATTPPSHSGGHTTVPHRAGNKDLRRFHNHGEGPSILALSYLRHYYYTMLNRCLNMVLEIWLGLCLKAALSYQPGGGGFSRQE